MGNFSAKSHSFFLFFVFPHDKSPDVWYNKIQKHAYGQKGAAVQDPFLYYTVLPVLVGDARAAGRIARELYCRHGRECHWLGHGFSLFTAIYARRHPLPPSEGYGRLTRRWLYDLAKEQPDGVLLCLIPCCDASESFLEKEREALEERYVILPRPVPNSDPLSPLIRAR